jgi:hypothetical protein
METGAPFLLKRPRSKTTARINTTPKVRYDTVDGSMPEFISSKDTHIPCHQQKNRGYPYELRIKIYTFVSLPPDIRSTLPTAIILKKTS